MDTSSELTYIYGLVDPRNNQLRYIGKADDLQARLGKHIRESRKSTKTHKCAWVHGLLDEGLEPSIVPLMQVPKKFWKKVERKIIKLLREKGYNLVNTAEGGDGGATRRGFTRSEATKKKISKTHKKLWESEYPEERRDKWRKVSKERWKNPEFRKKHAEGLSNPEVKSKVSKSQKKRWQSKEARTEQSKVGKRNWSNPELAQRMRNGIKAKWKDPEYRAMQSQRIKKAWAKRKCRNQAESYVQLQFEIED